MGRIEELSIKEIGAYDGLYVFTASYDHPDNFFYQCGEHKDMGGDVVLINSPGAPLNDLE